MKNPKIDQLFARLDSRREVTPTCMDRILAIPSAGVSTTSAAAIHAAEYWTKKLGTGGAKLRPVQGIALLQH